MGRDAAAYIIACAEGAPPQAQAISTSACMQGPPTANGVPHNGHVLTRVMKDLFPRYQSMLGKRVLRKGGWDTHGLPIEHKVMTELHEKGKTAKLARTTAQGTKVTWKTSTKKTCKVKKSKVTGKKKGKCKLSAKAPAGGAAASTLRRRSVC